MLYLKLFEGLGLIFYVKFAWFYFIFCLNLLSFWNFDIPNKRRTPEQKMKINWNLLTNSNWNILSIFQIKSHFETSSLFSFSVKLRQINLIKIKLFKRFRCLFNWNQSIKIDFSLSRSFIFCFLAIALTFLNFFFFLFVLFPILLPLPVIPNFCFDSYPRNKHNKKEITKMEKRDLRKYKEYRKRKK